MQVSSIVFFHLFNVFGIALITEQSHCLDEVEVPKNPTESFKILVLHPVYGLIHLASFNSTRMVI